MNRFAPDVVPGSMLESLAAEAPKSEACQHHRQHTNGRANGGFSLDAWLAGSGLSLDGPRPYEGGRKWIMPTCPWNADHTNSAAFIIQFPSGAISAGCQHDGCKGRGWHDLRDKVEPGWRERRQTTSNGKANHHSQRVALVDPAPEVHPEPIPLTSAEPPDIPADIFPGDYGAMVRAVADATETPVALPGVFSLAVVATTIQGKFTVSPEADYFEPVNLYVAPASPPATRKTAVVKALCAPLIDLEKTLVEQFEPQLQEAQSRAKTMAGRIQHLRSAYVKEDGAIKRVELEREIAELEAALPTPPKSPRVFTQDVTSEHLGTMMSEQGERLAILCDEGGIFDLMAGRYSNGVPNIEVYLKAHAGSFCRVDRGSRPPVILNHPSLCIGVSPQPEVVRQLNRKDGFRGRGLIARFLYALPPSNLGRRTLEPRPIDPDISRRWAETLRRLWNIKMDHRPSEGRYVPHVLRLDDEAYQIWKDHQRRVEQRMAEGGPYVGMRDWAGKLPGAVARIAAVFHCAGIIDSEPQHHPIGYDAMGRAVQLGELLAEHALAAFDLMVGGEQWAAERLWAHITEKGSREFSYSELWHPLRGTFKKASDMEDAVEVLLDHNLILEHEGNRLRPGRPARRYFVNPRAVGGGR